jgi:hypothetical protein
LGGGPDGVLHGVVLDFGAAVVSGHFKTSHLEGWVFDRVGKVEFKGKT